jgi:hypothetical protein
MERAGRVDIVTTRARSNMVAANHAYVRGRYSDAYALYSKVPSPCRIPAADVNANLAITAARLGLPMIANSHWSLAIETATARDVCAWARSGIQSTDSPPPAAALPTAPGSAWLRSLMDLTAKIDDDPENCAAYAERCNRFKALKNVPLALADALRWTECDPTSIEAWATCAELHHAMGDPERFMECVQKLNELGEPSVLAERCQKIAAPAQPAAEPDFPLQIFFQDVLDNQIQCEWPHGSHLLASFFRMFQRPLYQIDNLLGFPLDALRAVFEGRDAVVTPPVFPSPLFPAGFQLPFNGKMEDLDCLFQHAYALGDKLCEPKISARVKVCTALAVMEIAQLITRWIRNDRTGTIPHCELITAIILAWQKLADPLTIIMPRSLAIIPTTVTIQSGATVYVSKDLQEKAFNRLKEIICPDLCDLLRDRAMRVENISDFLHVLQGGCYVKLDPTGACACKLSARRSVTGGVEFGFVWEESQEERAAARGRVITAWTQLLTELKRGEPTTNALEFVYTWIHAGPVGYPQGTFGYVIVGALLLVLGFAIDAPLRNISHVEIEALLARNSAEFFEAIRLDGLRLREAPDYPSVAQLLPNLHVRIQALRRYPF